MPISDTVPWRSLKEWTPALFLLSGLAWLVYVGVTLYEIHVLQTPDVHIWLTGRLLLLGALGTLVALLGFYPWIADEAPRITGANAVIIGIGIASWIVFTVGNAYEWYTSGGGAFGDTTTWADFFWVPVLIAMLLGFFIYALVSFRSRVPSRSIGVVMILPALALLVHSLAGAVIDMPDPVLTEWAIMAVVMITLWFLLRTDSTSSTG